MTLEDILFSGTCFSDYPQDLPKMSDTPSHRLLTSILGRSWSGDSSRAYLAYILESAPQDVCKINHHAMALRSSCDSDLSASTMVD
eukprot:scaffold86589_cov60-Cyclotella_meneghiniana.AAC.1